MDGNSFLGLKLHPTRLTEFVFDLQRFNEITVGTGGTYTDLSTAVINASAGDTIKLISAVTLDSELGIDKNVTLDLNGQTLTTKEITHKDTNGKTIIDSTGTIAVNDGVTFTLDDSTGTGKISSECSPVIQVGESATTENFAQFVMKNGSIESKKEAIIIWGSAVATIEDGSITSSDDCCVYFRNGKNDQIWSNGTLNVTGGTLKSTGNYATIQSNGTPGNNAYINISGGKVIFDCSENALFKGKTSAEIISKMTDGDHDWAAIYAPATGKVTISGNAEISSTTTAIEVRAGDLEITGGKITSTYTGDYTCKPNGNGISALGAGISVSQHTSKKDINVNISGDSTNISGSVALAVSNPEGNTDSTNIGVTIDGGTFESTGTGESAIAAQNGDSRSLITINKGTFVGELKTVFETSGTSNSTGIKIAGTADIAERNDDGTLTVVQTLNSNSLMYKKRENDYVLAEIGWNNIDGYLYLEKTSEESNELTAKATLAPATGADSLTTLNLTVGASLTATPLALDLTENLFGDLSSYTILNASGVTDNKFKLNITGSDNITSILSGAGDDTLKAGSKGVSLNGGKGDDSLIGGAGKDTFIYNSGDGKDTIEGFDIANDIVSLGESLLAPTSFDNVAFVNGSNYIISLGGGTSDSLTFKSTSKLSIIDSNNATYSYTTNTISKKESIAGAFSSITLGSAYTSDFDASKEDNEDYATIDAANVTAKIKITGNDKPNSIIGGTGGGTLIGGDGADTLEAKGGETTLVGGSNSTADSDGDLLIGSSISGSKDTFIYNGGADSIRNYNEGDLVTMKAAFNPANATFSVSGSNVSISFADSNDKLIFESITAGQTVSLQSGKNTYLYKDSTLALGKSITLMSGYTANFFLEGETYNTINAAAVTAANGISITGNDNGNYIAIGTAGGSLTGGKGNDTFIGGAGSDIFNYAGGKDVIEGFDATDSLSITDIDKITKARASSTKLVFTKDKDNTITFKETDDIDAPSSINVANGGYLTKDGYVNSNNFTLFGSAKGRIDLADDLYKTASITSVDASDVKKQSVTLVGGTQGGSFTFAEKNKKRDVFEYGGGAVSISNYESGRDRINLGAASITGFEITNTNDVLISLDGAGKTVSLKGAKGYEVLIHQDGVNRGNSYSKMAFTENGVIDDKSSVNATSAILWSNADNYTATGKIKKVSAVGFAGKSITANNSVNTFIDASLAAAANAAGVSLIGGKKNDKFTGSEGADMFVYTGGKDVIQNFDTGDKISLGAKFNPLEANITSNRNFIKFKFGNKDALTIKPKKGQKLDGKLTIGDGVERTYYKDAIVEGTTASLTSKFSGTFKVKDYSGVTTVNGSAATNKNKLTLKGTTGAESLMGGAGKTTFKGGGGKDILTGGSGADTFFYAKGDKDTVTIAKFDFAKDNLKIANGTIKKVESLSGGGVQFAMKTGKTINAPAVGWFNVTTDSSGASISGDKVLIKANNTYYWFADKNGTDVKGDSFDIGRLITSDKKISSSKATGYDVIELNYATNLVKAGVAVAVKNAAIPTGYKKSS